MNNNTIITSVNNKLLLILKTMVEIPGCYYQYFGLSKTLPNNPPNVTLWMRLNDSTIRAASGSDFTKYAFFNYDIVLYDSIGDSSTETELLDIINDIRSYSNYMTMVITTDPVTNVTGIYSKTRISIRIDLDEVIGNSCCDILTIAGVDGATGSQGVMGPQGFDGPAGISIQGPRGFQGFQGANGLQGAIGMQGASIIGATGSQGANGVQGIQGSTGNQGASIVGPQGITGLQGVQGSNGIQGSIGFQGIQGPMGLQGFQGRQGVQGSQGTSGTNGTNGLQGATGSQGNTGAGVQGPQGVAGVQGAAGSGGGGATLAGLTGGYIVRAISATAVSNSNIYEDNNGNVSVAAGGTVSNGSRLDINGSIYFGATLSTRANTDLSFMINGSKVGYFDYNQSAFALGIAATTGFLGVALGYAANSGVQAFAGGRESKALGGASIAIGYHAENSNPYSMALGAGSKVQHDYSTVMNDGYSYDNLGTYITSDTTRQFKGVYLNGFKLGDTNSTQYFFVGTSSASISALSGTGTRMVVVSSTGSLSTQAIPSGGSTGATAWGISGNTASIGYFIGTTNNFPLIGKVNNVVSMIITDDGNITLGSGATYSTAGGNANIAIGYNANVSGQSVGVGRGVISTGDENVAIGPRSSSRGALTSIAIGGYGTDAQANYSIAIGKLTAVSHNGAFAMHDNQPETAFYSDRVGQFKIKFSGGYDFLLGTTSPYIGMQMTSGGTVSIGTTSPITGYKLDVNGDIAFTGKLTSRAGADMQMFISSTRVAFINQGSYNTFYGFGSGNGGAYNTFIGHNSGGAGGSGVGSAAVAVGFAALAALTSGDYNVAFGYQAGQSVTTGSYNVAFGSRALLSTTSGANNIGIGGNSLLNNITGTSNVSIGVGSLQNATNNSNTAIGSYALSGVTTGANNIGIGFQPGQSLTSGSNNIVIGYQQELASNTSSNQMNIGGLLFAVGMSGTVGSPAGQLGILTNAPTSGFALDVNGKIKATAVNIGTGNTLNGSNNHIVSEASTITSGASYTQIIGGYSNTIGASGYISGIFGGSGNSNSGTNCYIFGNGGNIEGGSSNHIFGGGGHVIFGTASYNTIISGGGLGSYVDAGKMYNTIIGGNAYAQHHGTMLLKDHTGGSYFVSDRDNQFGAAFAGGYKFNISYNSTAVAIKPTGILNVSNTPTYASNALALAGGLVAGDIYMSSIGALSIVY